jgi:hypothetical protein
MRAHRVRALLMGGQACVFYGAAEFSRDTDLAIVADAANLARLRRAFADLQADVIAVPPFELKHLRRGHAIHFRCRHPEALRMRVEPQEGDEHIQAARNPRTHERQRNAEGKLALLVFASGETAMSGRLLFLAGGLFVGDGLFFLLVGAAGLGPFL